MSSTTDENASNQEDPPDLDVDKLVKSRLKKSLPRILWTPLFYGVYTPLSIILGLSWSIFWVGMPWTGFGLIIAVAYIIFGIQAAQWAIGLLFVLIVIAAGAYGNLEPDQTRQVRDYGARGKRYAKWYVYNSIS